MNIRSALDWLRGKGLANDYVHSVNMTSEMFNSAGIWRLDSVSMPSM